MKKIRVEQYLNQSLPNPCKPAFRATPNSGRGLNSCALRFQPTASFQWEIKNGKLKIFTCHFTLDAETQEQADIFTPVMLNLFQHLTSLACNLFADKILKRVQDDSIRNSCNKPFNYSTVYITPSQPSLSREGAEVLQCKTWRSAPC